MAAPSTSDCHSKDIWGWDSQYLQDTVQTAVTDASKEYLAYLGPGNLSEDRARHILEEVKDAAMAAAHAGDW